MLQTDHDIRLVLVDREMDTKALRQECERQSIPLEEGSTNDLWRMSAIGNTDALALIGREPHGSLEEIFERGGSIWLLDGVQYPTNLGFGIRTIEVSGADAVVLNIPRTHQDRRTIRRSHESRSIYSRCLQRYYIHHQRSKKEQLQNFSSRRYRNC